MDIVAEFVRSRVADPHLRPLLTPLVASTLRAFDQAVTGTDPAQATVRARIARLSPAMGTAVRQGAAARIATAPAVAATSLPSVAGPVRELLDPPLDIGGPPTLGPNRLSLRVAFVRCERSTTQRLRDDMRLMVGVDHVGHRSLGLVGPIDLGKFTQHHTETLSRVTHTVDLPEDGDAHAFVASLYLAEHDLFGGFEGQVREGAALPDKELLDEAIALAILAGPTALGILTGTPGLIVAVAGLVLALVIEEVVAGAWRRLRDDIFPPRTRSALINNNHQRIDVVSGIETTTFEGFGGLYTVGVEWLLARNHAPKRRRPTPGPRIPPNEAEAVRRLRQIEHIVVLMLENRSFDHMLGFLRHDGWRTDVDPDAVDVPNDGHLPAPLPDTAFWEDAPHSHAAAVRQINGGAMDRFVEDFARVDPNAPERVMGYHPAHNVPVFHALAEQFCLTTRWFSSQPGSTWVNRLLMLTGRRFGEVDNPHPPFFSHPSLMRVLDERGVSWRVYHHDIPFLATMDPNYRTSPNFRTMEQFLGDCQTGQLPKLSWIDPNFVDIGNPDAHEHHDQFDAPGAFPSTANDDHPPTDIANGQYLVQQIVQALANGPDWGSTLFLVVYDEHGGFYDHVVPPPLTLDQVDDDEVFPQEGSRALGARVPAIVVSPRVSPRSVSTVQFDHTSIAKTVLTAFCRDAAGAIPFVGKRVAAAAHLGHVLDAIPLVAAQNSLLDGVVRRVLSLRAAKARLDPRAHQESELTTLMRAVAQGLGTKTGPPRRPPR